LRQFVDDITSVIQYIWEYDLSLKLCGHDKDELDYKFPLQVDHEIVPDVSLGSTGQREVVDFAFTIVIAGYLGLTEYPLYLDEVGSSFDTRHREKLIFYIKSLLETRQCEQLFMVNHYMAEYGSFANTDCVVLSKENIILPDTYNERVSIQYVD
jgi:ABC-type thiamine transport system ATPase subunit